MIHFEAHNNFHSRGEAILQANEDYFAAIGKDCILYLQRKLVERVLGGQYVGVISGMLRRSQTEKLGKYISELKPSLTVAPYAVYVANWARRKYGRNYMRILLDLFGADALKRMIAEFRRMWKVLNSGGVYKYKNPFPA